MACEDNNLITLGFIDSNRKKIKSTPESREKIRPMSGCAALFWLHSHGASLFGGVAKHAACEVAFKKKTKGRSSTSQLKKK